MAAYFLSCARWYSISRVSAVHSRAEHDPRYALKRLRILKMRSLMLGLRLYEQILFLDTDTAVCASLGRVFEVLAAEMKKKELKPVDHASVEYISFRKNFYTVPRALASLARDCLSVGPDATESRTRESAGDRRSRRSHSVLGASERKIGARGHHGVRAQLPRVLQRAVLHEFAR